MSFSDDQDLMMTASRQHLTYSKPPPRLSSSLSASPTSQQKEPSADDEDSDPSEEHSPPHTVTVGHSLDYVKTFVRRHGSLLDSGPVDEALRSLTDVYERLPKPLKVVVAPNFGSLVRTLHSVRGELNVMEKERAGHVEGDQFEWRAVTTTTLADEYEERTDPPPTTVDFDVDEEEESSTELTTETPAIKTTTLPRRTTTKKENMRKTPRRLPRPSRLVFEGGRKRKKEEAVRVGEDSNTIDIVGIGITERSGTDFEVAAGVTDKDSIIAESRDRLKKMIAGPQVMKVRQAERRVEDLIREGGVFVPSRQIPMHASQEDAGEKAIHYSNRPISDEEFMQQKMERAKEEEKLNTLVVAPAPGNSAVGTASVAVAEPPVLPVFGPMPRPVPIPGRAHETYEIVVSNSISTTAGEGGAGGARENAPKRRRKNKAGKKKKKARGEGRTKKKKPSPPRRPKMPQKIIDRFRRLRRLHRLPLAAAAAAHLPRHPKDNKKKDRRRSGKRPAAAAAGGKVTYSGGRGSGMAMAGSEQHATVVIPSPITEEFTRPGLVLDGIGPYHQRLRPGEWEGKLRSELPLPMQRQLVEQEQQQRHPLQQQQQQHIQMQEKLKQEHPQQQNGQNGYYENVEGKVTVVHSVPVQDLSASPTLTSAGPHLGTVEEDQNGEADEDELQDMETGESSVVPAVSLPRRPPMIPPPPTPPEPPSVPPSILLQIKAEERSKEAALLQRASPPLHLLKQPRLLASPSSTSVVVAVQAPTAHKEDKKPPRRIPPPPRPPRRPSPPPHLPQPLPLLMEGSPRNAAAENRSGAPPPPSTWRTHLNDGFRAIVDRVAPLASGMAFVSTLFSA